MRVLGLGEGRHKVQWLRWGDPGGPVWGSRCLTVQVQ